MYPAQYVKTNGVCFLCYFSELWQRISEKIIKYHIYNNIIARKEGRKEGNILVNNTLNTFYLPLYGIRHMVKDHTYSEETHSCHYMGYSFSLAARVLLYANPGSVDILLLYIFDKVQK